MNKVKLFLFVIVLCTITFAQEYKATEMFSLPWGWDNDQQIPIAKDDIGGVFGPYKQYVDNNENIYLAFPNKDFRKYNPLGKIEFRHEIMVSAFAVDDSENVFFNVLDVNRLNTIGVIGRNGELSGKELSFSQDNDNQNISWIKNRNGQIKAGSINSTALITMNGLNPVNRELRIPKDSKDFYYTTETSRRKTLNTRRKSDSFNNNYINLLKYKLENGEVIPIDRIQLEICRFNHKRAELLTIDKLDNFYFEIFYNDTLAVDIAILNSNLIKQHRIELLPRSRTFGMNAKPFVRSDGNIYEFRDLDDGLHVIRWSGKE